MDPLTQIRCDRDRDTVRQFLSTRIRRCYHALRIYERQGKRFEARRELVRIDTFLEMWSEFLSYEKPPCLRCG